MTTTVQRDDERLPDQLQATYVPALDGRGTVAFWGTADPAAALAGLELPVGVATMVPTVLPRTPRAWKRVVAADVPAVAFDVLTGTRALVGLDLDALATWRRPGASVTGWVLAARLACELVAHGHLVPGAVAGEHRCVARWRTATVGDPRIRRLADQLPPAAHAVRRDGGVWTAHDTVLAYLDDVADALARASATLTSEPFARALTTTRDGVGADDPAGLAAALQSWAAPVRPVGDAAHARLCVRLRPPDDDPDATNAPDAHVDDWRLDYLLQSTEDPSLVLEASDVWADAGQVTLADRHLPRAQEALVRGLGEAARLFPPIDASLSEARPEGVPLDAEQAADFLTEGASDLGAAGLGVQLPSELTRTGRTRLRARLRVGGTAATPAPGTGLTGHGLTAEQIGSFRWEVAVGDHTLDAEEFAELAAHKRSLVRWRGRWVHVDRDELAAIARTVGDGGRLDPISAVAAVLTGEVDSDDLGEVEVVAEDAAADLLERLAGTAPPEPRLDGIDAVLRPYQHRGVAWLQARADVGLGAVLADDMGLGKTLQSIALLAGRAGDRPHLVVCPASVVGNWERELARFAPDVDVVRHHGPDRPAAPDEFAPGSVTVTSYGTMRSDAELLGHVGWDVAVLDEAQAFKNHTTRTARVVRSLDARVKLPMTGTPVENRLAELWAIIDVAVPGLLGPFETFRRQVATPVERWGDEHAAERLRRLTGPFVLRRTKRDDDVAPDLPDKQEQTVPVTLTAEQATLYQAVVDELLDEEALGEGMERRGRILKLLGALKQVCNHPAQYLGEQGPLAGRSGKLVRATELLAEVVDAGDRALVFTQYRQMGQLLVRHLTEQLDVPPVPFLHGGTSLSRRDELVDAFQTDESASPILLVSLRAGGTGLNLTRASHVVHYDRWWNPAVEDQATDRAYRIGQDRTVFVHKLTTTGTLEERIAEMLERKRALADAVVGSGEAWLTELDDDQLRTLVHLDRSGRDPDLDEVA